MREQTATIMRTGPRNPREPEHTPTGYKRTEVGIIPEDWQTRRIGDIFETTAGGDFNPKSSSDMKSETHQHPIYANSLSQQGLYGFCIEADYRPGSITTTARGTLGRAFYRDTPFVAIGRLLVLDSKIDMDARYFGEFINYGVDFAAESTGVPQLTAPQVKGYYLPVPPSPEQRAIAAVLSDVDELIGSLEALIAKKRAIKQAAMQELLTRRTRLPGFGGEWEVVTLGKIGKTYGGLIGKTSADFGDGNGRYISFLDVLEQVTITRRRFDHVRVSIAETQNRVAPDDVLFNATSETPEDLAMGSMVLVDSDELYLNSFCFGFRIADFNRCDPLFLAYFSRGIPGRKAMYVLAQGATRYNLSKKRFLKIQLPLPPLPEQRAIATILSDMDAEIAALDHRLDKTRAIKQGMMQQLLTGSIRLPIPDDDTDDDDAHDA